MRKRGRPPRTDRLKESDTVIARTVQTLVWWGFSMDREILLLREFEQLSYAEIADLLQLPLNTVRSRLFRARTALRNLLEPPAEPSKKDTPLNAAQKGVRE